MAGDPPSIRKQGELYERFQSAPAIDGGRSTFRSCSRSPSTVFQSAPAIDGGRSDSRGAAQAKDLSFQSAPAIDGGRSAPVWRCWARAGCFNPRPPSMAGDPELGGEVSLAVGVSIRARHRWRAILLAGGCGGATGDVSIRARHRWRAIPRWWGGCLRRAGFNPRPPSMAGDPHQSLTNSAMSPSFNPRPPSMAGDPSPGSSM